LVLTGELQPDRPGSAQSVTYALPNDLRSPSVARSLLREVLVDAPIEAREAAQVLVSEMVTNVVLHTTSILTMQVDPVRPDGGIRVMVEDASPDRPQPRAPEPDATDGRGLWLINEMATSWGWERTTTGKRIWFEL
jgi:serine/threonine-protein kinase RsbW